VAQVLIAQTIAALGARAGSVVLLTEDAQQVVLAASRGYPAESLDAWRAFSVDAPVPLAEAIRTGQAVWLPSDDAWLRDYLHLTHHHRQMGGAAAAAVPLVAGSQPIGAIGLTFDLPQRFGDDDRQLIWALAHQGAVALERARLYDGELAARTAAESAARLRDEFLSVAAHELRTPLAGLYAFAQLLGRQYARAGTTDPSLLQRGVEVIAQQADKLSRLIGQLLDISRLETRKLQLDLEPSDLAEVVRQVVARVRLQDPQHPIDIQGPSTLPAVVDSLRLEQVVTNLVDNALRYSPDGLPIEIELERDGAAWARLAVRDHGPGVAAEHRQRIFERFYQVEIQRHRPGLGLGLYISRQIVDLHGGELIAEFPSDGGSRFVIRLPLDGRPSDAEMPAAPGVQSADGAADRSPGAAY
jgi:signal transduction histidine kinase